MKTTALNKLLKELNPDGRMLPSVPVILKAKEELRQIETFLVKLKNTLADMNDRFNDRTDPSIWIETPRQITNLLFELMRED